MNEQPKHKEVVDDPSCGVDSVIADAVILIAEVKTDVLITTMEARTDADLLMVDLLLDETRRTT